MSRECTQAARPRPCNVCGATDHRSTPRLPLQSIPCFLAPSPFSNHFRASHRHQHPPQRAHLPCHTVLPLSTAWPPSEGLQQQAVAQGHVLALLANRHVRMRASGSSSLTMAAGTRLGTAFAPKFSRSRHHPIASHVSIAASQVFRLETCAPPCLSLHLTPVLCPSAPQATPRTGPNP
jgi:hypothetical protein